MNHMAGHPLGWQGYRSIGLVANPFLPGKTNDEDTPGVRLTVRASALRLIAALDRAASAGRPVQVRVVKPADIPSYYTVATLADLLGELAESDDLGIVMCYMPLLSVRDGVFRSALARLAELVAGRSVELTLAAYIRTALAEPDTSLPSWAALEEQDIEGLIGEFTQRPADAVVEHLGPPDLVRDSGADPERLDRILKESSRRQETMPSEALEADTTVEQESDEGLPEPPEEGPPSLEPLAEYVIAHLKAHVSPVIARGVRAYVTDGTASMTEELKLTRAPRKTLQALMRFALFRFRKIVFLYDQFEAWELMPADMRVELLGSFAKLRWVLGDDGTLVVAAVEGEAPEIDDLFAAADRVSWSMEELSRIESKDAVINEDAAAKWLMSAVIDEDKARGIGRFVAEKAREGLPVAEFASAVSEHIESGDVEHAGLEEE